MYDEKIKYYEEDKWKYFFENEIANLYANVEGFLDLREEIKAYLESRTVDSVIKEKEFYKSVFFGGLQGREDKPFVDNGLANFYKEGLGISVSDISLIISRMKDGSTLESSTEGMPHKIESTDLVSRFTDLSSSLSSIFRMLRDVFDIPKPREIEVKDENFGIEAIKSILDAGKAILPRYNPISFFINSLYSLPYFYAKEVYPKLFEEDVSELLSKYGLQMRDLLEPDIPDDKIREERKVIGWAEDSVGILMREVILDVCSLFSMNLNHIFFNIEDEFAKYAKASIDQLRRSIVKEPFSDVISKIESVDSTRSMDKEGRCKLPSELRFRFSDGYGESKYYQGIIKGGEVGIGSGDKFEEKTYKMSYSEFIAFLAPQMLLGLSYIRPIAKDRFSWICMMGWL